MANPSYADVSYDVGDARNVTDGSTAIKSFIAKAVVDVVDITGTTVAFDNAIRSLADMYTINSMVLGLGPETVGRNEMVSARKQFYEDANIALKRKGYSLDGIRMKWKSTT